MLQEFDFMVKDHSGIENQVVGHLSRLEDGALVKLGDKGDIDDIFLHAKVFDTSYVLILWFFHFAN